MTSATDLAEEVKSLMFPAGDEVVMLDLPPPVSVNAIRKIDWANHAKMKAWKEHADLFVLAAKRRAHPPRFDRMERFVVTIILSEDHCALDLDNACKGVIDYLKRIEIIADDAPKNLRGLHVIWGKAPSGCRVIVRASDE